MKYLLFLSLFLLSGFKGSEKPVQKQFITAGQLKEWVSYLASDAMKGRRNGSPEMKTAALWIEEKFVEMGLKPVRTMDGLIQNYSYSSRQTSVNERNIIGFIEGSDPALKNEYIVLSAHFDHIGIRPGNSVDSICNGADDNASGTITLIGIARFIRDSGLKPGRSIVFAAFSGEENGMRGSRYFVANSPVPVKNIYADMNFEMNGHSELLGKGKYYMTGCNNSNLDDLIGEFNRNSDCQLIDTIQITNMLFNSSDNIAFSRISVKDGITTGIPSGTFATTTMAPYIHNVSDEATLFDFENMAMLVNHFGEMVLWMSNSKSEVNWTDARFTRP